MSVDKIRSPVIGQFFRVVTSKQTFSTFSTFRYTRYIRRMNLSRAYIIKGFIIFHFSPRTYNERIDAPIFHRGIERSPGRNKPLSRSNCFSSGLVRARARRIKWRNQYTMRPFSHLRVFFLLLLLFFFYLALPHLSRLVYFSVIALGALTLVPAYTYYIYIYTRAELNTCTQHSSRVRGFVSCIYIYTHLHTHTHTHTHTRVRVPSLYLPECSRNVPFRCLF